MLMRAHFKLSARAEGSSIVGEINGTVHDLHHVQCREVYIKTIL